MITTCLQLSLQCQLCDAEFVEQLSLPGWASSYRHTDGVIEVTDVRSALCPKHAAVEAWFWHNCPGCVEGFPDCTLGRAYQYSPHPGPWGDPEEGRAYKRRNGQGVYDATMADTVAAGVCPTRTNGSLSVNHGKFEPFDMRQPVVPDDAAAAGPVFANAIQDYIDKYWKEEES